jgi:hypothetical protein
MSMFIENKTHDFTKNKIVFVNLLRCFLWKSGFRSYVIHSNHVNFFMWQKVIHKKRKTFVKLAPIPVQWGFANFERCYRDPRLCLRLYCTEWQEPPFSQSSTTPVWMAKSSPWHVWYARSSRSLSEWLEFPSLLVWVARSFPKPDWVARSSP